MGKRAGTENTPGIAGFLKAAQLIQEKGNRTFREQAELKEYTISRVLGEIKGARLNGHRFLRVPNNLNFTFPGVSGPRLLALLNLEGVMVSTGSACNAANAEPSHVLTAMGVSEEAAESSIRMTFGYHTTRKEVEHVINLIKRLVEEERERTKP